MKVSISVGGRFHGFNMASYFQKQGILKQLVTGYPKSVANKFGIHKKNVLSIYINELINRFTNKIGLGYPLNYYACEIYDFLAARLINKSSDIYFIWSGYGLKTIRAIRDVNPKAKIILVRGSSHISEQQALLKLLGPKNSNIIDQRLINKELKEYEEVDFITVPSTFVYNTFIERGFNPEKLFLNFLGVDLEQFPFKPKMLKSDKLVFGNIGTLSDRKNVTAIIKVIAELNGLGHNIELILVGPIDYESFNQSLLENFDFLKYKGKINQEELYQVYSEIDVFVINSIEEGMAMVQLQAMSCGCPIIATTNSGGLDLITNYENGIVIPILDNDALKTGIIWFCENRDKITEMGVKSFEKVKEGFTWDDFGRRNLQFMSKILKN